MVFCNAKNCISLLLIAAAAVRSVDAWSPSMEIRHTKKAAIRTDSRLFADYSQYNYNDGRYYPYDSNDRYNYGDYDQGYGYSNVNYPATANGLSRWTDGLFWSNNNRNRRSYSPTPILETVAQSLFGSLDFSRDLDEGIERLMTPLIKRSAFGRTGILRKGTNDFMRKQVPRGTDMEMLFDQALSILKYDSYISDELLGVYRSKPVDLARNGRSVFSQTSSSRMAVVGNKLNQKHLVKIGVSLNYDPWEMWVVAEDGILQSLVLYNPESNYEYNVVEGDYNNYNGYNNYSTRYLNGASNDYVDAEILDKNGYGYSNSNLQNSYSNVNYNGRNDYENVPFNGRMV